MPMLGETVSHYKILEKLGQGGMGEVFTAHDTQLGRDVALKFLSETLCSDPEARRRFEREARAIAALNHPHICTIYEIGDHAGRPFLAMEYLEGNSLDDVIAAGPLPIERLQSLAFQLCDALQEAHSKGILHRDIKPANVFLDLKGTAKLLDFGLAMSMSAPMHEAGAAETVVATPGPESAGTMDARLTQVGAMLGTILYMSPEQFRGEKLDARSDLYSLGRVLYEAATGSVGFEGKALGTVAEAILTETTPLASTVRPDIPRSIDLVIHRLLQKAPENRMNSASEVREAMIVGGQGGLATGSAGPSGEGIRTLGQLRSATWLIPLLLASIPLSMYIGSVVDGGEDEWVNASPLLMFAFLGWAGAWWVHRRSSRRAKPSRHLSCDPDDYHR
jgi:serine/threonine protein kinase